MTELIVEDEIAERLRQIARQEGRPLEAVLRSMLESYPGSPKASAWPLVMANMTEADSDIVWNEYAPDLSERSREILDREFADYLTRRLRDDGGDSA